MVFSFARRLNQIAGEDSRLAIYLFARHQELKTVTANSGLRLCFRLFLVHPLHRKGAARTPKLPVGAEVDKTCRSAPVPGRSNLLHLSCGKFPNCPPIPPGCGRDSDKLRFREHATKSVSRAGGRTPPTQKFDFGIRNQLWQRISRHYRMITNYSIEKVAGFRIMTHIGYE